MIPPEDRNGRWRGSDFSAWRGGSVSTGRLTELCTKVKCGHTWTVPAFIPCLGQATDRLKRDVLIEIVDKQVTMDFLGGRDCLL